MINPPPAKPPDFAGAIPEAADMKPPFTTFLKLAPVIAVIGIAIIVGFHSANEAGQSTAPNLKTHGQPALPPVNASPMPKHMQATGAPDESAGLSALGARLAKANAVEAIQIGDQLVAQNASAEPSLLAALKEPLPLETRGIIANIFGRIGSDTGIQAVMTAASTQTDPTAQMAMISGLTTSVSTPEAAGLMATAAQITSDPALLVPIIETVGRLGDEAVLRDLVSMFHEPETIPGQRSIVAQMIAGMRNPELRTLLAGIAGSEETSAVLREAAKEALNRQGNSGGAGGSE